jgi:CheY-like chemotaxis protein
MNLVLLAEDDAVSRAFLSEALTALGWHCTAVAHGLAALETATRERFDLLLLDHNLPGCNGDDVLARLRASSDAASRTTPAWILTADPDPALRLRLLERGFAGVGHKPIDMGALARLLRGIDPDPAATPVPTQSRVWDDAVALRATGGQTRAVQALRELMQRDLPSQRGTIRTALERGDYAGARAELHRLRAACGFCGAAALGDALYRLDRALQQGAPPGNEVTDTFFAQLDLTLASTG